MGEILFTSLIHVEREMGKKVKRAIKKEINIDYVSEGWWKVIIKHCIKNKVELDIFDKTPMKDELTFVEKVMQKKTTKREMKIINFMRIK